MALTVACGPASTGPLDTPDPPEDNREILDNPSFASDINEILQRRGCANHNCHGSPGGRANLMLTTEASFNYSTLVDRDALSEDYKLVEPNNPDSSYVIIRFRDLQRIGLAMPLGGPPLDSIDMSNFINWINTGAPNN